MRKEQAQALKVLNKVDPIDYFHTRHPALLALMLLHTNLHMT